MTFELPSWIRLQKALAVEAERGFGDLEGREYRFSEFLCLTFGEKPPNGLAADARRKWRDTAARFAQYGALDLTARRHLVATTRQFLYEVQRSCEALGDRPATDAPADPAAETDPDAKLDTGTRATDRDAPKRPRTTEIDTFNGRTPAARDRIPNLDDPLTYLKGVGPRNADRLGKLGLLTVTDLLFYYPRDYLDYARQVDIRDLEPGETATIVGTVERCNCFTSAKNAKLSVFELVLRDRTGKIRLSKFFAGARFASPQWQAMQKRMYPRGATVAASGLVKEGRGPGVTLDNPDVEVLDSPNSRIESLSVGRVLPVYALTEGVTAEGVRRAVISALPAVERLPEPLPRDLRDRHGLCDLKTAIAHIHFPPDADTLTVARQRIVFDEFFYLQLGLLRRRLRDRQTHTSAILAPTGELIDRFYQLLPFTLTGAQQRVVNDILTDLNQPAPMNRLVQGDVGSGKTVVATIAILAAIQSGYQAALMAPTEVLAEQHYRKFVGWFNQLSLPVELLTGSTPTKKRRQIHAQLQSGELPVLIGTHALIQEGVEFARLGLVVVDEQHRFGVEQRAKLQQKGIQPHVLTMTATPIPRTLSLTLHGDLDVSAIDELPPGRQAIQTTVLQNRDRPHAYDLIRREVAQGRQVYVVLPLVEQSEKLDLKSAIEEHQHLSGVFPECVVGLLHGRMSAAEKDAAISAFRDQQTQILVSTTVIEVGVDVPNATVMLIEHAERFGLAQLHQLRGRVGRGAAQSFCLLIHGGKSELSRQRLAVLEQSQDGFAIAEMDLRFRGPGEVLGRRQSGLPDLALASLVDDREALEVARRAAEQLLTEDPELENYPRIAQELHNRYRKLLGGTILT